MSIKHLKYYFAILFVLPSVYSYNWCSPSAQCDAEKHTMCERIGCPISEPCNEFQLTNDEKNLIVRLHNTVRNNIAKGLHIKFPEAANMRLLYWNDEIAEIAQCWANSCQVKNDKCRKLPQFFDLGQNIATVELKGAYDIGKIDSNNLINSLINKWSSEIINFTYSSTYNNTKMMKNNHFTQMIWADTQYIGCGRVYYKDESKTPTSITVNLVCNYGPDGNMENGEIYRPGMPCVDCKCHNKEFNSLCALNEDINVNVDGVLTNLNIRKRNGEDTSSETSGGGGGGNGGADKPADTAPAGATTKKSAAVNVTPITPFIVLLSLFHLFCH